MDDLQNLTEAEVRTATEELNRKAELLKAQQERWITFCAIGGLVTLESDDETKPVEIKQLTITEFAEQVGVSRQTLYNWKRDIPHFATRVRARRLEVFTLSRETAAFNKLYLIGMTGKGSPAVEALTRLLGHFAKLELATQRHEIEAGQNLMELVNAARKKKIIEGETVGSIGNGGASA